MTESDKMRSEGRARILKALAHPSRIYIVDKLAEKPYLDGVEAPIGVEKRRHHLRP